jgi:hypothetical protein
MKRWWGALGFFQLLAFSVTAEPLRINIAGTLEVSLENSGGVSLPLSYTDSALISLAPETRFFRGIELELIAPQNYLAYRNSMAMAFYGELKGITGAGIMDIEARQLGFEPLPNKIQTIYQIPLRSGHGLRATPYVSIPTGIIEPGLFPLLLRLMPVMKGLNDEFQFMQFRLTVKPILSDEGAVKITPHFPQHLPDKPFAVYIDDEFIGQPQEERILKSGEHQLVILSDDYRGENRRFLVERGKIIDLVIVLRDAPPQIDLEAPVDSLIVLDGTLLENHHSPYLAEPGFHEVKFQVSDYSIIRNIQVHRGKTYRVALSADLAIYESE